MAHLEFLICTNRISSRGSEERRKGPLLVSKVMPANKRVVGLVA